MFETDLVNAKQGQSLTSQFVLKVKNLCLKINLLNPEELISKARIKCDIFGDYILSRYRVLCQFKVEFNNLP